VTEKKKSVMRAVGGFINPLGPLVSMKRTVESGWNTIKDIDADLKARRRNPKVRSFSEALAARPRDAIPLGQIERSCLYNRRAALAFAFLALVYSLSSIVAGSLFGVVTGLLFTTLCCLTALKYAHRSWQIKCGKARPSEPLGSLREFCRSKGAVWLILNPRLFE